MCITCIRKDLEYLEDLAHRILGIVLHKITQLSIYEVIHGKDFSLSFTKY